MNRIVTTAAAAIIGGFALLTLGACNADIAGSSLAGSHTALTAGSAPTNSDIFASQKVAGSAASTGEAVASTASTIASTTSSNASTGSGSASSTVTTTESATQTATAGTSSETSSETASGQTAAPATETQQSASTSASHHQTPAPKIKSASISCEYSEADKAYHAFLSYEVANATGMALSIDNPGVVGSFGTYDWHGTIEIPSNGCYASYGQQTYTLYTLGGTGPQASKTITRTGTYTVITPPPFSTPTTQAPIPTPTPMTPSVSASATTAPTTT